VITGVMLLFVLLVSVGEEVNEMQLAGWIGSTDVPGLHIPGWMGTWFSLFDNWQTFAGQAIALALVLGSYFAAQYLRVWRPRRRGGRAAQRAVAAPQPVLR
jgi:high-affinity iron transporter